MLALLGAMLLLRLFTLGSYPLMDTSEARYGEIARVMLTTGNWVTPQEIPGTPFWAKPPLYAWFSAAAMRVLGINEFALRLPALLCALVVALLSAQWAASLAPRGLPGRSLWAGLLAAALLATGLGFFVAAGAVMTDPALAACVTAMLACFYQVVMRGARAPVWRFGFFAAIGLGMLAKGPVILLYGGLPIALWTLWYRRLAEVWTALPWVAGTALAALICVPWYLAAENATPGFLNYFLLGEHVMRFLQPGWRGDMYGTAHAEPLGTIWLYLAYVLGAQSVLAACALYSSVRQRRDAGADAAAAATDGVHGFLLLVVLVPVVFFSFAGNIIWTYVLPTLGPLAVLLADFLAAHLAETAWRRGLAATLGVSAAVLFVVMIFFVPPHVHSHSSAALVAQWQSRQATAPGNLVYLGRKAPASLRFYSRGTVPAQMDRAQILAAMAPGSVRYVALAPDRLDQFTRYAASLQPPLTVTAIAQNKDLAITSVSAPK